MHFCCLIDILMGGGTYAANEMNPGFDIGMIVVYRNYPDQKPYYLPDDTLGCLC